MPAVNVTVTWPDGDQCTYYAPSTVVLDHFQEGAEHQITAFMALSEAALMAASERVRQKFGFACSAAAAELEKIEQKYYRLQQQGVTGDVIIQRVTS